MNTVLTKRFNLPLTYTNEQGERLTLTEACLDSAVPLYEDLNLWQLDGLGAIDDSVAKLTGMKAPAANQFSQKPIVQDANIHELLVWQGVNRFLWLTQQAYVGDMNNMYAIDQTHSKTRIHIHGGLARSLLCRGLQVDISENVMPRGTCLMTHLEHMGVTVLRLPDVENEPCYQVWVMRGLAVSMFEFLQQTARTLS